MKVERAVPLAIVALAVLYLAYAAGIEHRVIGNLGQSGMTAKSLPLILGAALLVISVVLTLQAFRRTPDSPEPAPNLLVWLAILLSVVYVLLLRPIGFVISTGAFVYLLVHLGRSAPLSVRLVPRLLAGLAATTLVVVALQSLVGTLTTGLARTGRDMGSALLSNRLMGATLGLAVAALVIVAIVAVSRKLPERIVSKDQSISLVTSLGTTIGLYLIFRQIFQVNLPAMNLPF